jgi:prepilin-type N-terminal cleavage/methylation domain-containing protein
MGSNIAPAAMTSQLCHPPYERGVAQSLLGAPPRKQSSSALVHRVENPSSGFTLIELVVVIVIVGIMAAMAVISFGGILGKQRAEGVVQDVTISLRMANQKSVFQQEKQDIVFNFKKGSYHREFLAEGKHSRRKRVTEGDFTKLPEPFQFLLVYFPDRDEVAHRRSARITFYPDGTATDSIVLVGKQDREADNGYSDVFAIEVRGSDSKVSLIEDEYDKAAYLGLL